MLSERSVVAEQLTPREREIMRCVADGFSNAEIARRLWIAPSTVRKHLENIFDKVALGAGRRRSPSFVRAICSSWADRQSSPAPGRRPGRPGGSIPTRTDQLSRTSRCET
jgi:DNA-binding CsgD family transcriptional regulator